MTIGPITTSHREISVSEPVSPALERVKTMLFRPFDLGRWFVIGFCAWLAQLGEAGSGFGGNFNGGNHLQQPGTDLHHTLDKARNYMLDNLDWIIPVAAAVLILCLAFWVLFLWLSSRGKFMFLHCVALNRAEVTEPWHKFEPDANSLFRFRLLVGLIGSVLSLPLLVIIAVMILRMVYRGEPDVGGILLSIGLGLVFILIVVFLGLVRKFTMDFVVPIMFLRRKKCLEAWREFFSLLSARFGMFVLYILFLIVLEMAIGTLIVLGVLVTCCIAGCLLLLPFLGTVLLLPVLVFRRSYSLHFLAQFGPEYNVFPPPPPAQPSPGLPPLPAMPPAG